MFNHNKNNNDFEFNLIGFSVYQNVDKYLWLLELTNYYFPSQYKKLADYVASFIVDELKNINNNKLGFIKDMIKASYNSIYNKVFDIEDNTVNVYYGLNLKLNSYLTLAKQLHKVSPTASKVLIKAIFKKLYSEISGYVKAKLTSVWNIITYPFRVTYNGLKSLCGGILSLTRRKSVNSIAISTNNKQNTVSIKLPLVSNTKSNKAASTGKEMLSSFNTYKNELNSKEKVKSHLDIIFSNNRMYI